ncbi:hypothetical protein pdam_00022338 [Pocillopora damicornis]|uniref:Uncharacterized protein n=1 Tax=Pocillopora damicornis TaxID=46731 RepID=A0A3M6UKB7_POCDA|nr:hypothetical protein pdam_00022338 [Pocillopora damicornis]
METEMFTDPKIGSALSSEFHSTSSTSESPQKKGQWEKIELKTKIMGTAKLEGTSPLTVVPTTGYGKELEEPWGRKGMLPLPGSSIFGPEEELVEPRMKLQRIKGTSPLTVKPTTGHVKELIEKGQGRKGMFPLPGSSTFDPEEELEELRMKLQRMEGSSSPLLLSTTDLEEKLGRVCEDLKMLRMEGGFPVLQFSTVDLEKKLDELCMEFQRSRMKGTLPPPELFTADLEDELKGLRTKLNRVRMKGASSSEFHSISSISKSPQNQEELKKWKQKTKIVETEKLKGTSPLTVIPTTGHGKELIGKAQGRKGEQEAQFELISKVDMFSVFSYYVKFQQLRVQGRKKYLKGKTPSGQFAEDYPLQSLESYVDNFQVLLSFPPAEVDSAIEKLEQDLLNVV